MNIPTIGLIFTVIMSSTPTLAGWLSDTLEGKPPSVNQVAPCVANPALCAGNEAYKEHQRQQQIQDQNQRLQAAIARQNALLNELAQRVESNS